MRFSQSRSLVLAALVLCAGLLVGARAQAASVSSTRTPGVGLTAPDTVLATITDSGELTYDDLEIQCKAGDAAGSFGTTTPGWSVGSVVQLGNDTYIRLTRTTSNNANETVKVTGPHGRAAQGEIRFTLTSVKQIGNRGASFCAEQGAPGLSPFGLGALMLLLMAAGGIFVSRTRRRETAA